MDKQIISSRLNAYLQKVQTLGGTADALVLKDPATESEVAAIEAQLGMAIPNSFRQVLLQVTSELQVYWNLYDDESELIALPEPLREVFAGDQHWGLHLLPEMEDLRQIWIKGCFPNPSDDYDRIWHNKLAFCKVGNGDLLAIDLTPQNHGKVVYLSHDDSDMHGYIFGNSFESFLENSISLGCVGGGEDWQMEPFTNGQTTPLDATCENALLWMKTMGLPLPGELP